jgi:glycosyltransferase domain-containing protein
MLSLKKKLRSKKKNKFKINTSILISIKNRPHYTIRILRYLESINCRYPIIIGDGSDKNKMLSKFFDIKNLKNLKIKYFYSGLDKNYYSFFKKNLKMLELVKTKYCLFIPDDDFYNIKHISYMQNILDKDNNISCVNGITYNFVIYDKFYKKLSYQKIGGKMHNHGKQYNDAELCSNGNIFNRLRNARLIYLFDSLHRTKNLKYIYKFCISNNFNNFVYLYLVKSFVMNVLGKTILIKKSFCLRQINTQTNEGLNIHIMKSKNLKFLETFKKIYISRLLKDLIKNFKFEYKNENFFLTNYIYNIDKIINDHKNDLKSKKIKSNVSKIIFIKQLKKSSYLKYLYFCINNCFLLKKSKDKFINQISNFLNNYEKNLLG